MMTTCILFGITVGPLLATASSPPFMNEDAMSLLQRAVSKRTYIDYVSKMGPCPDGTARSDMSWASPDSSVLGKVTWTTLSKWCSSPNDIGPFAGVNKALRVCNKQNNILISWEHPVNELFLHYADADQEERVIFETNGFNGTVEATKLGRGDKFTDMPLSPTLLNQLEGNKIWYGYPPSSYLDDESEPDNFSVLKFADLTGFNKLWINHGWGHPKGYTVSGFNAILGFQGMCLAAPRASAPAPSPCPDGYPRVSFSWEQVHSRKVQNYVTTIEYQGTSLGTVIIHMYGTSDAEVTEPVPGMPKSLVHWGGSSSASMTFAFTKPVTEMVIPYWGLNGNEQVQFYYTYHCPDCHIEPLTLHPNSSWTTGYQYGKHIVTTTGHGEIGQKPSDFSLIKLNGSKVYGITLNLPALQPWSAGSYSNNAFLALQDICLWHPTPAPTPAPPTAAPTAAPTAVPTPVPTQAPTPLPTSSPTALPTSDPTPVPTKECRVCALDFSRIGLTSIDKSVGNYVTLPPAVSVTVKGACKIGSQSVDLVMRTSSPWSTQPSSATIIHGSMFRLNVQSNTSVVFEFDLVQSGTSTPLIADEVVMSVLDVDAEAVSPLRNKCALKSAGFASEVHGDDIDKAGNVYAAAVKGTYSDNPVSPFGLSALQKRKSIAFKYRKMSHWSIEFEVQHPARIQKGRAFFLTGASDLMPNSGAC